MTDPESNGPLGPPFTLDTGTASVRTSFVSYDARDVDSVHAFVSAYRSVLGKIRSVGVTADDRIAHCSDEQEIIAEIGRLYIAEADLTLVLVGERTWTRRFVDWEVASSAVHGCAVLAVPLGTETNPVPARVQLLAEAHRAVVANRAPTSVAELAKWLATARSYESTATETPRAAKTPLMRRDAPVLR